ncbi:hypothetical protein CCMSSC00406_0008878 [Pleurotus cornucopiae]|uniref:Uncharacterized protein n=1 Tax=Pleurotus cornucopiae TaxID=5321 RepID=A0ACB7ISQ4_PLECO|nr:hypothetical protein CCMSSC00406_0008878 [Pleurotus cornucopiae]
MACQCHLLERLVAIPHTHTRTPINSNNCIPPSPAIPSSITHAPPQVVACTRIYPAQRPCLLLLQLDVSPSQPAFYGSHQPSTTDYDSRVESRHERPQSPINAVYAHLHTPTTAGAASPLPPTPTATTAATTATTMASTTPTTLTATPATNPEPHAIPSQPNQVHASTRPHSPKRPKRNEK